MKAKYNSVFDIPVKDQYGNPNMLNQYSGKVLVFINTTGHCGNVPQ
jgi:glutathione peroxidase-family protein